MAPPGLTKVNATLHPVPTNNNFDISDASIFVDITDSLKVELL